jgi:hypothetical protein
MGKAGLFLVLGWFALCAHASPNTNQASVAIQDAMQNMHDFKPELVIPSFNAAPPESRLQLRDDEEEVDELMRAGVVRAQADETAQFVINTQNTTGKKTTPDDVLSAEQRMNESESTSSISSFGCADGSCDVTRADVSDDINEGFSRLGALAGTAEEASLHQTHSDEATIFKGTPIECESYRLGLRNCCTDDGLLDGLIRCPASMQVLQRAKNEKRVIALGSYKPHRFSNVSYVYCVFPTKLARIIQYDGRQGQLHKMFGTPKYPDCSGLTPEQLESMDFAQFNLSEFIQDVTDKTSLPADNVAEAPNVAHVESLYQQGRSHD